jgi:digeranylgeranylglycerophospholipid reductase
MINIIGAGPAGLFSAYNLARLGQNVHVYDIKKRVGEPVHCTGLVTRELEAVIPIKTSLVVNRFSKVRIRSLNTTIEAKNDDLLLDRKAFDEHLALMAGSEGAKLTMGLKGKPGRKTVYADGPNSIGRGLLNPKARVQYYIGRQAICRGSFDKGTYEVYLGSLAPEFFAWIVPENEETARIGLASKRNADAHFKRFMAGLNAKQLEQQGGLIPVYRRLRTQSHGRYLIGDAACQVKATTGGGLVPGLKAAKILAECISENKDYHTAWRSELSRDLYLHLQLRKTLDSLSDEQYDSLLVILKGNKGLEKSRDRPMRQALALLQSPRLLAFGLSALARRLYARP